MALDAAKAEKLRAKYEQLKQANAVLKKGLLDKQDACEKLEVSVKDKEVALRQQMEEIDHLQFQNSRQSKTLDTMSAQVEDMQKQRQQAGWSMQGLISGKQQQELVEKTEDEIRILREELMMKIQENEEVHMRLFESSKQHEDEERRLREIQDESSEELREANANLSTEKKETRRLLEETRQLSKKLADMEDAMAKAGEMAESLRLRTESEKRQALLYMGSLEGKLSRLVQFDEAEHGLWALWNCSSAFGREARCETETIHQLRSGASEVCSQSSSVFRLWTKTFAGPQEGEPLKRENIRSTMAEAADHLATGVTNTIPAIIKRIEPTPGFMQSALGGKDNLKASLTGLLRYHRRWVTYQCLLLLHDCASVVSDVGYDGDTLGSGGSQTLGFVDSLWHLHRCVRTLIARLRLCLSLPAFLSRRRSAAHFALARKALRKGVASRWHLDSSDIGCGKGSTAGTQQEGVCVPRRPPPLPRPPLAAASTAESSSPAPLVGASTRGEVKNGLVGGGVGHGGSAELDVGSLRPGQSLLAASLVAARVSEALQEVSRSWESVDRCLSKRAAVHQSTTASKLSADGVASGELLEAIRKLCASLTEQAAPAANQFVAGPKSALLGVRCGDATRAFEHEGVNKAARQDGLTDCHGGLVSPAPSSLNAYVATAASRLREAPASMGFEEAVQTRQLASELWVTKTKLENESRHQARQSRSVKIEMTSLSEELSALQDHHAVLQLNFRRLQEKGGSGGATNSKSAGADGGSLDARVAHSEQVPLPADLVLSSRQRALLEGVTITQQETASLRQHGFFVDVLSLSASEGAVASGPPNLEALQPWELAVRKVYEQHARNLQAQVQIADGKAMEFCANVKQNMDMLKDEEEAQVQLRDEVLAKEKQFTSLKEDMATTRKNYDTQLAMLTEHICSLSARLSEKDAALASLQANKVLCGHCGMWNTMGKLLNSEGGNCQTCKEKVLSKG